MTVYRDTAANVSATVDGSVVEGRSFIETCVRLDEQMADINLLAAQVSGVNAALTGLEAALGLSDGAPKVQSS
jgi:expansin (peptidoglycan-binding protein)